MKRQIININEEKCTGCSLCIPNCNEGALQLIDGKARLISDLFCDGLGACIGHCPEGAITIIEREAERYDEIKVISEMVHKGANTVKAHLVHLVAHNEMAYLKDGLAFLRAHNPELIPVGFTASIEKLAAPVQARPVEPVCGGGCPGSAPVDFRIDQKQVEEAGQQVHARSELCQWPVQLHLLNPAAGYFKGADVVLASDCSAFTVGDFHNRFLKGKILAIACPKLDSNKDSYVEKLAAMITESHINTLTVVMMEVPCCGGLLQLALSGANRAGRKIPIKRVIVSVRGEIMQEEWI
ncbi:MAG: 4Fe-4S ferredoxin [Bacteroidetes bacterium HGW-Bacteroidetes-22]|nr:MAG: 4Fe-4S ferredoxin [Bacteroidetes bacterium HGW-Bacteroidetes-22]